MFDVRQRSTTASTCPRSCELANSVPYVSKKLNFADWHNACILHWPVICILKSSVTGSELGAWDNTVSATEVTIVRGAVSVPL